jgi:hypothetical protein
MPEFDVRERPAVALVFLAVLGPCVLWMCGCAGATAPPSLAPLSTMNSKGVSPKTSAFSFATIDAPGGPPTEILGINNLSRLCGFYGDPSVGFTVRKPYEAQQFHKQLYPGAVDTVVAAINNTSFIAGWFVDTSGGIWGFTEWEGIWTRYQDNHLLHHPQYTKILGISDDYLAVGYYQLNSIDYSFELDLATGKFQTIAPPNATSSAATGINGRGDIVGWLTLANGATEGWLLKDGVYTVFTYPSAAETQAASLDRSDDIAGSFKDNSGNTHGFLLTDVLKVQTWAQIDDPNANGETVVTGINNHHSMVGYYQDSSGNLSGFLANPKI